MREAAEAYEAAEDWWQAAYRWETVQETAPAAEAYRKADKLRDAARCFAAAGQPLKAAEIYRRLGNLTMAASLYAQAGDPRAVALYLDAGDLEQAAESLRRLPAEEPGYVKGVLLLAPKLVEGGRPGEALQLLGRATAADPQRKGEAGSPLDRLYWESRALKR